jgi:hypothetical protein
MDTHLFVEIAVQQCHQGTLQPVHSVEDVVINLFQVAVISLGADQRNQKLNTEQRYEHDGGLCHPPAETELVTQFLLMINIYEKLLVVGLFKHLIAFCRDRTRVHGR